MKTMLRLAVLTTLAMLIAGCARQSGAQGAAALGDLPASYRGQLACADCKGIRHELALFDDGVYTLKRVYLGPGEGRRFHERGHWRLDGGSTLVLDGGEREPSRWQVRHAALVRLDRRGEPVEAAAGAELERLPEYLGERLEGTYWKLIGLNGEDVPVTSGAGREAHLVLHAPEGRIAGATGCNRLMGSYRLDTDRVAFSGLATTRMACAGAAADLERRFVAALASATEFRVLADRLELYDTEGAVVARFEVVHLT
ncbi:META domain-containing protein [Halomonas sp. V046]|uniref:META domain-containing protein n=1 Tax=Halomonas sp. V046 TaxID=3459611 RepID=UPI004044495F